MHSQTEEVSSPDLLQRYVALILWLSQGEERLAESGLLVCGAELAGGGPNQLGGNSLCTFTKSVGAGFLDDHVLLGGARVVVTLVEDDAGPAEILGRVEGGELLDEQVVVEGEFLLQSKCFQEPALKVQFVERVLAAHRQRCFLLRVCDVQVSPVLNYQHDNLLVHPPCASGQVIH